MGNPARFGSGNYSYQWQKCTNYDFSSGVTDIAGATGLTCNPGNPATPGITYIRRKVTSDGVTAYSNIVALITGTPSSDQHYIRSRSILKPSVTTKENADLLTSTRDVAQTTQYFNDIGRPIQTVIKQGSLNSAAGNTTAYDLVTLTGYDNRGREVTKFLTYASGSATDGAFRTNAFNEQNAFNANLFTGENNYYYSLVNIEKTPDAKVEGMKPQGLNWIGSNKGTETFFSANTFTDEVRVWFVTDGSTGQFGTYFTTSVYDNGQLYKNITKDENSAQVIEFINKDGLTILKKVQLTGDADEGAGSSYDGWLCTYYIYDKYKKLRAVIQPEGVKYLKEANWSFSGAGGTNVLNSQLFRYEYDQRNRTIMKKTPDAGPVYMMYDQRDRLVMTQDANMRALPGQEKWQVILYDAINRPVYTGMVFNTAISTPERTFYEHLSNAASSVTYPFTTPPATGWELLTETHYDNYTGTPGTLPGTFDNTWASYFSTSPNTLPYPQPQTASTALKGMQTYTKTGVLGVPGMYLYTVNIYDEEGRAIQTKSNNITGGVDITTVQYNFAGQPLAMVSKQQKADIAPIVITIVTKNTYDTLGRLAQSTKNIINNTSSVQSGDKVIAQNLYDALGQLKTKKLGVNSGIPVETQAYDYNIRGWLLGMNRNYVNNSSTAYNFGFDLAYDKPYSLGGLPTYNMAQYTGNIAGTTWRGKTGSAEIRRYNYSYDKANHILKADFGQFNGSAFSSAAVDYSIKMGDGALASTAYDLNGNILKMWQKGQVSGSPQVIDDLTYTYNSNSNKLAKVVDAAAPTSGLGDFNNGTNSGDDYAYDSNGNLTKDENKSISNIAYNILNLPEQITVTGKGTITYLYDATGNKLGKMVNETGQPQKVTTYLGNLIFENNVLQHVATEEGRARLETGVWKFDYFLKDHLGNVRMMLADNGTVLEETHYYPFGLTQKGISTSNPTASLRNKDKTFQGQKFDDDLGLNYYGFKYRNHDPQIGRFIEIDPLASDYVHNSVYAFSENQVTAHVELEGLEKYRFQDVWNNKVNLVDYIASGDAVLDVSNLVNNTVNPLVPAAEFITGKEYNNGNFNVDKPRINGATETLMAIIPGTRIEGAMIKATVKAEVAVAKTEATIVKGELSEVSSTRFIADAKGVITDLKPSVKEQAAGLSDKIGKNSITLQTPTKQIRYDLAGKDHAGVPTPHVQVYNKNFVNGQVRSISRASKEANPMTQQEVRMLINYIKKNGK